MRYEADSGTVSTDLLLHEVRVWHRLNHRQVLRLFGECHVDKRYFVSELAPNGELSAFVKKPGNELLTCQKLFEAALGLQYLHTMNVVHNDLKCDNIMVRADGNAKLIDFGLSALVGDVVAQVDVKKIGAMHWKSPEYLIGGPPSFTLDMYSFAMCIIEAVSGDIPWGPMDPCAVRYHVKRGTIPNLPGSVNERHCNLVELMTKEPMERVEMAFVMDKLREFAREEIMERAL